MAKIPSYPVFYDELKKITISKLKEWGYLKPETCKRGIIRWTSDGENSGSIRLMSRILHSKGYIEVSYAWEEINMKYLIIIKS